MHFGLTVLTAVFNPQLVRPFANVLFQIRHRAPQISERHPAGRRLTTFQAGVWNRACPSLAWLSESRHLLSAAWYGAGEGNRTLVFSLEGCCSTIELHPRQGLPNTAGRRSQLPRISGPRADFPAACRPSEQPLVPPDPRPLNNTGIAAYIDVFRNQRKEVIQCLLPSAVTSLGSPAKL
jgi:hypothetical protein